MEITETQAYERYDAMLDEVYGDIEICGLTYTPSGALKAVDPIAYRVGFSDYLDTLEEDDITVEGY